MMPTDALMQTLRDERVLDAAGCPHGCAPRTSRIRELVDRLAPTRRPRRLRRSRRRDAGAVR